MGAWTSGEWERASGTALADAPVFLRISLQLGTYVNSTALRAALLQWCYSSRNSGANPPASSGNGTSADDDRMQVDSLKKGKRKGKGKTNTQRKSHDQHELYRHQHVQELWQTWIFGERLLETLEERTTIPLAEIMAKA